MGTIMRLSVLCQAVLLALALIYAANGRVIRRREQSAPAKAPAATSSAVSPFRRALPPTADGCPASQMRLQAKSMLTEILQTAIKTKSEELVSFEEKGCKGGKCFKNLFTKLTCKCQIRSRKDEGMLPPVLLFFVSLRISFSFLRSWLGSELFLLWFSLLAVKAKL